MTFDVRILAAINFSVQVSLMIAVFFAAYVAKKKKEFQKHCTILRVAIFLQIIAILFVMLPSITGYILNEEKGIFFNTELLIHHFLGISVVLLWVYINLVVAGRIKLFGSLVFYMRMVMALWVLTFLIGLHVYWLILAD